MITPMVMRALGGWAWLFIALLLGVAIMVPVLNLATDPGSFFHVPSYGVVLFGKYLTYALLALSIDLVWGYCGILSLGHGAFFALGGYAMGMYLMRQIGSRGVYADPVLPDFMVFLNWKELPWFWYGFDTFAFAALMVVAVPGLLAFVFGWFAFRSRVTGVYLSIITQAMTFALLLAFFRNDMGFGGNNGLTDFKDILGFDIQADTTRAALLIATAATLALGYLVCRAVTASKLGKVLIAIRDAESRALLERLRSLTKRFERGLEDLGMETIPGDHPVVPLMIRDTERTREIVRHLFANGVLATGLAYPVVPRGDEEIRFQVNADHTEADVDRVLEVLREFGDT